MQIITQNRKDVQQYYLKKVVHTFQKTCVSELLEKIKLFFLEIVFPIHCLSCNKEGIWICECCFAKIKIQTEHLCPICEKTNTPNGLTCISCKRKSPLDGLIVATSYQEKMISKAVHFFKYRFISDLQAFLGTVIVKALTSVELPLPDLIISIPLHSRRLRWRGFNQAELLAQHVSKNLLAGFEIKIGKNILTRKKYTQPQMEIKSHQQRLANIQNAFSIKKDAELKGKTVLLIDDVATTGSTIVECARILKQAGAEKVYATVIARQEYRK